MPNLENASNIILAPNGDLRLSVDCSNDQKKRALELDESKPFQKTLVVSSAVMCIASPVWDAMFGINGRFIEAQRPSGPREVHLAEDDFDALRVILGIAHLQFKKVPKLLSYHQLLKIAIICDKYDTVGLVRPCLPRWEKSASASAVDAGYEERLFVAWTFGCFSTYETLSRHLVLSCTIDILGESLALDGKLLGEMIPPGATGQYYRLSDV